MPLSIQPEDWPQTEMEYHLMINSFGAISWRYNHDANDGRIDVDPAMEQWLQDAQETARKLWDEIAEKFDVVHPSQMPKYEPGKEYPPAPKGKTYPHDWMRKMEAEAQAQDWNNSVCSACPFGHGDDIEVTFCYPFTGIMRLPANECGIESFGYTWKDRGLPFETTAKAISYFHGYSAEKAYLAKKEEITSWLRKYTFWSNLAYHLGSDSKGRPYSRVCDSAEKAGPEYVEMAERINQQLRSDESRETIALEALAALKELEPHLNRYTVQNYHQVRDIYRKIRGDIACPA